MNFTRSVLLLLFLPVAAFCQNLPASDSPPRLVDVYLIVTLAILLMIIGVAGFLIYRTRQQAKALHLVASKDREIAMFREQLYVNVTHELRTPLSLVISPLEKLAEENPHPDIQTALFHARELLQRFNDILKWNKLESNAMTVTTSAGEMIEEVEKVITRFRQASASKNIRLEFNHAEKELWGIMDFEKLETILSNLLMNAVKFTEKGGEVKVHLEALEENGSAYMRLVISDNGRGIPQEVLPVIFERFNQVGISPAGIGGSGIGLALVKRLTDLSGGQVEVASETGKGSVFTVTLPFQETERGERHFSSRENAVYESPDSGNREERPLLLLVEDNTELRSFIVSVLAVNYEILQASTAEEGLNLAKENLPEIVITDVMLPGEMDGIALCSEIKTGELTSHIPVLVLTARTGIEIRLNALDAKADSYLTKPFSVKELEMTLQNLLESRRMLRERFQKTLQLEWSEKKEDAVVLDPFLETALEHINRQLDNSGFGVEQLADAMRISRVQLFKKMKSLTGMPPADLLRTIRLEKAKRLLQSGASNVSATAYQIGFDDPNYFSKAFKKHFGISPSEISRDN